LNLELSDYQIADSKKFVSEAGEAGYGDAGIEAASQHHSSVGASVLAKVGLPKFSESVLGGSRFR
jgi:hypothetical protein